MSTPLPEIPKFDQRFVDNGDNWIFKINGISWAVNCKCPERRKLIADSARCAFLDEAERLETEPGPRGGIALNEYKRAKRKSAQENALAWKLWGEGK